MRRRVRWKVNTKETFTGEDGPDMNNRHLDKKVYLKIIS